MTIAKSRRRLLHTTALAGSLALSLAATAAAAQEQSFNIPAQSLAESLRDYGMMSGEQIIFAERLVEGRKAPAVQGSFESDQALRLLLAESGLTARRSATGGIMIERASDPQSGSAAGGGAEVEALIVTAQKREEDIQDVPIAISAFSQEDLTRSQVAGGPDLMTQVPNMTFTKTNFSSYSIQIRGIGTQAISATTDPAVAVAFNNTPFIRNRFFEQEFYDLQRVEVLRGPQGTLYGRNATAGVVNIISAKPRFQYEAKLSGDIGNYGSSRLEGMINLPLSDDAFALRIAGAWTKREGYVTNLLTSEQTDGRDLWSTRVSLRGEPTDWLEVNLIWEHFQEKDDRLRSGKQLCMADPGLAEVNGQPVEPNASAINFSAAYFTQGCLPASMYSPDSFQTPNGYALGYYGPLAHLGSPAYLALNPYASQLQSRDLRAIETHLTPVYEASADLVELQVNIDLPGNLSLASETGYNRDRIFSFEDYNRFDTTPGVFVPGAGSGVNLPDDPAWEVGDRLDIVDINGIFCDPQLGCTDRLAAGDLSTAKSRQFSQEFRLSSNFDGPFNFNLGANFLRYDTEEKYYVFVNTLSGYAAKQTEIWAPGVVDNRCQNQDFYGDIISNPDRLYFLEHCLYVDQNNIHNLNDNGRNYFVSRNPYHLLSYAAFGEAYYNITPDLKMTAGLRWTVDKKQAPQIPSWLLAGGSFGMPTRKVINLEWREPTGRIALDWKPDFSFTDETLVYGSFVRGYKAGGANPPPPVTVLSAQVCTLGCQAGAGEGNDLANLILADSLVHPETFEPEFVNAYEIGTKNTLLDGRLTANLSAFYYDYKGYQISQIVNRSAVNLNFDADIWGVEVEVDWRPLENLRLGFKGGYENTRMADGSQAIDLIDRTAGDENYTLMRPFPTLTSNCVVPTWLVTAFSSTFMVACAAYKTGLDPVTFLPYVPNPTVWRLNGSAEITPIWDEVLGYPGYDPTDPANANRGEGIAKDLSGNEFPNAPDFTATITADYTIPLPNDWLVNLHTDLYYQSEAWTRIFNTEGYDKLKAYSNINLAAIFTNEDAGWTVMAYIKNVLDRDAITGAFLNSDDTGLTTNVFLTEPRLYGIRVTKAWGEGPSWWGGLFPHHKSGAPYPLTVEVGGQNQRRGAPNEVFTPFGDVFPDSLDPSFLQDDDALGWSDGRELQLTYQPSGSAWKAAAGIRYGRTDMGNTQFRREELSGEAVCRTPTSQKYNDIIPGVDFGFLGKLACDPDYPAVTMTFDTPYGPFTNTFENKYDPDNLLTATNRISAHASRREEHSIVDFAVGMNVGMGLGLASSSVSAGLRYAEFESDISGDFRGIPDMTLPEDGWGKYNTTFHQYMASFESQRDFTGYGPTLSWEAAKQLWGGDDTGRVNLDWRLTGGVLFGKQQTSVAGAYGSNYFDAEYPGGEDFVLKTLPAPAQTPIDIPSRNTSATVPVLDLSLGLSYDIQRFKIGAGYRWERYFDVIDGGFEEQESYDRTIDGPYFRLAIGFGG